MTTDTPEGPRDARPAVAQPVLRQPHTESHAHRGSRRSVRGVAGLVVLGTGNASADTPVDDSSGPPQVTFTPALADLSTTPIFPGTTFDQLATFTIADTPVFTPIPEPVTPVTAPVAEVEPPPPTIDPATPAPVQPSTTASPSISSPTIQAPAAEEHTSERAVTETRPVEAPLVEAPPVQPVTPPTSDPITTGTVPTTGSARSDLEALDPTAVESGSGEGAPAADSTLDLTGELGLTDSATTAALDAALAPAVQSARSTNTPTTVEFVLGQFGNSGPESRPRGHQAERRRHRQAGHPGIVDRIHRRSDHRRPRRRTRTRSRLAHPPGHLRPDSSRQVLRHPFARIHRPDPFGDVNRTACVRQPGNDHRTDRSHRTDGAAARIAGSHGRARDDRSRVAVGTRHRIGWDGARHSRQLHVRPRLAGPDGPLLRDRARPLHQRVRDHRSRGNGEARRHARRGRRIHRPDGTPGGIGGRHGVRAARAEAGRSGARTRPGRSRRTDQPHRYPAGRTPRNRHLLADRHDAGAGAGAGAGRRSRRVAVRGHRSRDVRCSRPAPPGGRGAVDGTVERGRPRPARSAGSDDQDDRQVDDRCPRRASRVRGPAARPGAGARAVERGGGSRIGGRRAGLRVHQPGHDPRTRRAALPRDEPTGWVGAPTVRVHRSGHDRRTGPAPRR